MDPEVRERAIHGRTGPDPRFHGGGAGSSRATDLNPHREGFHLLITMVLEATGGTTTGLRLPDEAVAELGGGKRPRVRATFSNGFVLRARVGSHEGVAFLAVSTATREAAGLRAGDVIEVEVELDDEPDVVEVPDELAVALDADAGQRRSSPA